MVDSPSVKLGIKPVLVNNLRISIPNACHLFVIFCCLSYAYKLVSEGLEFLFIICSIFLVLEEKT